MKPVCCLLIDDDTDEHEFFLLALQDHYDCSTCWCAHSVAEAVQLVAGETCDAPDFIFMDWRLNGIDAALAISILMLESAFKAKPLFVLSLMPPALGSDDLQRLGIRQMIRKQGSIQEFGTALKQAIESQ